MVQLLWQLVSNTLYFGPAVFLASLGVWLLLTGRFPPIIPPKSVRRPRLRGAVGLSGGLAMAWLGLRFGLPWEVGTRLQRWESFTMWVTWSVVISASSFWWPTGAQALQRRRRAGDDPLAL